MRRRLGSLWPALSHYFNLHPWDVGRLSFREIAYYEQTARAWIAEANKKPKAR